jgi:hypothetical protein
MLPTVMFATRPDVLATVTLLTVTPVLANATVVFASQVVPVPEIETLIVRPWKAKSGEIELTLALAPPPPLPLPEDPELPGAPIVPVAPCGPVGPVDPEQALIATPRSTPQSPFVAARSYARRMA